MIMTIRSLSDFKLWLQEHGDPEQLIVDPIDFDHLCLKFHEAQRVVPIRCGRTKIWPKNHPGALDMSGSRIFMQW